MIIKNCDAEKFIERLQGRTVICFGAGVTLKEEEYEKAQIPKLEEHIAFFIDNDVKKQGLKYQYHGREFDIKSAKALASIKASDYVILITCVYYVEIYKQLKEIAVLKDIDCYLFSCVCFYPKINVDNFLRNEIEKENYEGYRKILKELKLKDKHKGERCFIIGNGPSLNAKDLELLKNEKTFAANRIYKIFPKTSWRPTYYACIDCVCYGTDYKEINGIEASLRFIPLERAFAAGKVFEEVIYYNRVVQYTKVENGEIVRNKDYQFSRDIEEVVYGGYTVLYDLMQFAVYMGFKEIYLLGVDHSYIREVTEDGRIIETGATENYFTEEYLQGLENVAAYAAQACDSECAYRKMKKVCEELGIVIKNATRGGKLDVFDRIDLDNILQQ